MDGKYAHSGSSDEYTWIIGAVLLMAIARADQSRLNWFNHNWPYLAGGLVIASSLVMAMVLARRKYLERKRQLRPGAWDTMSGGEFEDQIVIWLRQQGYSGIVKSEYFDQGIDIIATKQGIIWGVQVKRSSRPVGVTAIRAVVAGLRAYGCTQGMVVTNANFTSPAKKLALVNDVQLCSGQALKRQMPSA